MGPQMMSSTKHLGPGGIDGGAGASMTADDQPRKATRTRGTSTWRACFNGAADDQRLKGRLSSRARRQPWSFNGVADDPPRKVAAHSNPGARGAGFNGAADEQPRKDRRSQPIPAQPF